MIKIANKIFATFIESSLGRRYFKDSRFNPVNKTSNMTQPVGLSDDGKLYTAPGGDTSNAVLYTSQTLTDVQKTQARNNIGAYSKPSGGIPAEDMAANVIPRVGNGRVTIKQNGVDKGSFTLNSSENIILELDAGGEGSVTTKLIYVLKTADVYEYYESTFEELYQAVSDSSATVVIRVIDDVDYFDDYSEYRYSGFDYHTLKYVFSNTLTDVSLLYIDANHGTITSKSLLNPAIKTDMMTQAVGRDANGLLWTIPGGGSGDFDIHSLPSEKNIFGNDEMVFYDVSASTHKKIIYDWLRSDIKALLDQYYIKGVNGKRGVLVNISAKDIRTDTSGIEAFYSFSIEGEFDSNLIGMLNEDGTQATAAQVITALQSGKGVQFGVYDQTHSIDTTTATNFRYLISNNSVNIVFTTARGHYYTPANILISWNGSYWDETEYDRDHDFPTYTHVPDISYRWNVQELLDTLQRDSQTKTITDSAGYYTTDTVEGALAEVGAELAGINTLIGSGVIT